MHQVVAERPEHWPHGCELSNMDGGCFLVREASSRAPVAFVGWQERVERGRRIGYYSIGVRPEYRGMGLAKQAVQRVLAEKVPFVDEVRASISPTNAPSIHLARALGVTVKLTP